MQRAIFKAILQASVVSLILCGTACMQTAPVKNTPRSAKVLTSSGSGDSVQQSAEVPSPVYRVSSEPAMPAGGEVKAPVISHRENIDFGECAKQKVAVPFMLLEAVVDERGQLRSARFLKPVPSCADDAVMRAISKWEFRPGTYRDKPVSVIFNLTMNVHYR